MEMAPSTVVVSVLLLVFLAFLATLYTVFWPPDFEERWSPPSGRKNRVATNWALLVAGSRSWENYRHQADVAHAFHLLRENGIPPENIVTMMFDDVANDPENPHPGTLYNDLSGRNYYSGLRIDYSGDKVNAETFLRVLEGTGEGKVINSGPEDNVLLFYADHGGVGVLGMPVGRLVTRSDLIETLQRKKVAKGYRRLVVYLESCEAGSMFQDFPTELDVYAMTAANPFESSFAVLCPSWRPCLADEFSLSWMRDSETNGIYGRPLSQQFSNVKKETVASHVSEYGALEIRNDEIAEFQGSRRRGPSRTTPRRPSNSIPKNGNGYRRLRIQDIPLEMARGNVTRTIEIEKKREMVIAVVRSIVESVVEKTLPKEVVSFFVRKRRPHSHLECASRTLTKFDEHCARFSENPFAFKYSFVFANLCAWTREEAPIVTAMVSVCGGVLLEGTV
uniref:legumain n=1 Tax=Steinernema glaseri TaxID=37863 RepID=A0A1I7ZSZ2_9BILA